MVARACRETHSSYREIREMKLPQPNMVHSASVYPDDPQIRSHFTRLSSYDEDIVLYKVRNTIGGKSWLWAPREACPMAEVDRRAVGESVNFHLKFEPRNKEQARVIAEASDLLVKDQSFIIRAPTGFGKTAVTMPLIAAVGRKTLIVVTKEDVKIQWRKAVKQFLQLSDNDIGYIQGDICNVVGKKVVIAMIQSACKEGRYPKGTFSSFGLFIADEVHRLGADQFSQVAWQVPALVRLGLSATPKRKDGKDIIFRSHIGPVRVVTDQIPMVPKIIRVVSDWTPPYKMKVVAGRTMHVNKAIAGDRARNALMADFISQAYSKGRNVVFFSDLREKHLEPMFDFLRMRGIPARDIGFYVGGLTEHQQDVAKAKQVVLTTYAMCSEATDAPWWDTAVLGTPRSDVVQIVGRITREYPDKNPPVVFDVIDLKPPILQGYAKSRLRFYQELGAEVVNY